MEPDAAAQHGDEHLAEARKSVAPIRAPVRPQLCAPATPVEDDAMDDTTPLLCLCDCIVYTDLYICIIQLLGCEPLAVLCINTYYVLSYPGTERCSWRRGHAVRRRACARPAVRACSTFH